MPATHSLRPSTPPNSLAAGLRRAALRLFGKPLNKFADPEASALSTARQKARLLHIPESAIAHHLATARRKGQSDIEALNDLLSRQGPAPLPRHR